jgi:hypothetical protein
MEYEIRRDKIIIFSICIMASLDLSFVKGSSKLVKAEKLEVIYNAILSRVRALPDVNNFRNNTDLIHLVCNLAENAIKKKWGQVDKKAFVVRILNTLFTYNVLEKAQVEDVIEFLHSNNQINKVENAKKVYACGKNWLKKKVLN